MTSSINAHTTFFYSQPEMYRFSHDSIFLAREIFEKYRLELSQPDFQILDLCAGCGVIGLDLLFHQLKESTFSGEVDFLEVQSIYQSYFDVNQKTLREFFPHQNLKLNWIQKNYLHVNQPKKYDLIVANPPYFLMENGVLSDNEFKNRCRFFIDSNWLDLLFFIKNSLKENGTAHILVRNELKKLIEKENYFDLSLPYIEFISQIRGTWHAKIKLIKIRN